MMDNSRLKFKAWDLANSTMSEPFVIRDEIIFFHWGKGTLEVPCVNLKSATWNNSVGCIEQRFVILQYTGLPDKNGQDWYVGDIGSFDNGDRFVLRMEDWLEVFSEWIGDPECEDQTRDLYRISNAEKIGDIHTTPELLA